MMSEIEPLDSPVSEYRAMVAPRKGRRAKTPDTESLVHDLSREHDWTEQGARAIVALANDYGVFVLRNALALAIALDKEDGDLGF